MIIPELLISRFSIVTCYVDYCTKKYRWLTFSMNSDEVADESLTELNIFWALFGAHFKMSLSRAQNLFMPANINSIVLLIHKAL